MLASFKLEQTGFIYLVNGQGQVQLHKDAKVTQLISQDGGMSK